MTAALLATIAATEMITGRKDHQPVIQIVVLSFNQRNHCARNALFRHRLKGKRGTSATRAARSTKAAFEILAVEQIVDVTKETQRPGFAS